MPGENPPRAGLAVTGGQRDLGVSGAAVSAAGGLVARSMPALLAGVSMLATTGSASAAAASLSMSTLDVMQLAMFVGVMGAALLSAVWLIRERGRTASQNIELRGRVAELGQSLRRAEALINVRDQRIVVWANDSTRPDLVGALPAEAGAPEDRAAFLAFGRWLMPRSGAALEQATNALRERSADFDIVVETRAGAPLEVQGRKTPQHIFLRFQSLSEQRRELARLRLANNELIAGQSAMLGLLDSVKMPFWVRAADGRLTWVNQAYVEAVEASDADAAIEGARELLGTQAREAIAQRHAAAAVFEDTVSTVIGGDRRVFSVTDFAGAEGSAGMAADISQIEAMREEHQGTVRSHANTLDQLTTAVAIFDSRQRLRFHNQSFQKLWNLDQGFLAGAPDNAQLLDRLRSDGKLAEQPEWRRWKEGVLDAYRSIEPREDSWHLPDGRTIRVVASPQPDGGVTWIFENLTEKIDLESRYRTAVRVQGETLDNLAEGVAVFGPDGRIRLSNPAFARLWGLAEDLSRPGTHISAIRATVEPFTEASLWPGFVAAVTGFDDERRDRRGQADLVDGTALSYAVIHLPNGQVMITFVDVTDSVRVQRALKDKNEALQRADQLKNDFVQHVSYELRSPLTNIIGFTELLGLPDTGPLTRRQHEYLDHIGSSSSVLLTIVNDILDLATVDAGIMELEIGEVKIDTIVASAAELISDRLHEHRITLDVDLSRAPQSFHGDENRIRQILFNLLSNAVNYAPEGSTIGLTCTVEDGDVVFAVHDDGPGMSPDVLDTAFQRFESRTNGGRRRGAGLGLSIVKSFVELHGGKVAIESAAGRGTTVICRFPAAPTRIREAAE